MSDTQEAIDKLARTMEVSGGAAASGSGIAGFVTQNHELIWACGVAIGALVGIAGLLISWHYKHKHFKLEQQYRTIIAQERLRRPSKQGGTQTEQMIRKNNY